MSIIFDCIIVFFFIVGVISTVWIVWEYADEWFIGKDLMLPKIIYNYNNEQVFYDKHCGEIIFSLLDSHFAKLQEVQYFIVLFQIQHCMTQTLNVRFSSLPDSQFHGVIYP